ncbi:MAG: 23S rRNA (uracil(1939)-C(5))-methyltransferase RlmD [Clostridia bacterium]|nr:23S rRNA (uracil(1939)-C(5))-methyltransferase RlmD [Clostridia bacterium]
MKDYKKQGQPKKNNISVNNTESTEKICSMRRSCGGCQTWNLTYPEECSMKMGRLIRLLGKYGHVEEILAMDDPYHYRNKLQAIFRQTGKNQIQYGIYQSSGNRIVKCDDCLIENEEAAHIVRSVYKLLAPTRTTAWDESRRKGQLRHVMVRHAAASDTYMVALVTSSYPFPGGETIAAELVKRHPKIASVVRVINMTDIPLWMEEREEVLYGNATITDKLNGCLFRISARSFYQVNTKQTERLYETALEFASPEKGDRILDAYCGIGTIGIAAAKKYEDISVLGFDNNENAVHDAEVNARINGLENVKYRCRDAEKIAEELMAEEDDIQIAFVDPPRAGCGKSFLDAILVMSPEKIVYVSCNPESLAKDLTYLKRNGAYKVKKIQPVDMFPRTTHVETVCLLSKLNAKQHIEINLDMDELDLTDAEKKATYQEIKDYVLEHSGLKVSSLYIAQVKQKCGIIERENYNKPKSEDAKQPQCPTDKEKAIKEALKHFGMI